MLRSCGTFSSWGPATSTTSVFIPAGGRWQFLHVSSPVRTVSKMCWPAAGTPVASPKKGSSIESGRRAIEHSVWIRRELDGHDEFGEGLHVGIGKGAVAAHQRIEGTIEVLEVSPVTPPVKRLCLDQAS